jgi:circadian clock protein KaiC
VISHRSSTGVPGLDDILDGGFVTDRLHLVEGLPGTGKTTLGLQFLLAGREAGERLLYVSMSENRREIEAAAATHGWSLEGIEIFELAPPGMDEDESRQTLFHSSEVELSETMRLLLDRIERVDPQRMVLDSLSEMRLLAQSPLRYRRQIFGLKHFLGQRNTTVLLLDDMTGEGHDLQLHSLAHGVITLQQLALEYGAERRKLRVTKMRGVRFRGGYHDYIIRSGGIEVFPRLVASEHRGSFARDVALSGSRGLDALLGGGLRRGTSALLMGPAGSGKSSIALSFAYQAAERGERPALFAFDEGTDSILHRAEGLGMDIRPMLEAGTLTLSQINPAEMSPGEFTAAVRKSVTATKSRLVVIDSLNGYLHAMPDDRYLALEMHELLTFLNQQGVVTLLTIAQHGILGHMASPVDLSYLSDAVLLLRFFEAEGKIRKAISVIKKRVGAHEDTIREFRLSDKGLTVGEPLVEFQGIMTGVPTYLGRERLLRTTTADAAS